MRDTRSKQFKIKLNEKEHAKLFELAREKGMSVSEYIRFMLLYQNTIYIPKEEKVIQNEK